jgi:hypothetical protein
MPLCSVFTSIAVLGPARRLSWQIHGEDRKRMLDDDGNWFPSSLRGWILSIFLVFCHTIVNATIGEPYNDLKLLATTYSLGAFAIVYSSIKVRRLSDTYPYYLVEPRPRPGRVAMLVLMQIVFFTILGTTRHSIFPDTGSKFSDMGQGATLFTVMFTTTFARRTRLLGWISNIRRRIAGFTPLRSGPEEI